MKELLKFSFDSFFIYQNCTSIWHLRERGRWGDPGDPLARCMKLCNVLYQPHFTSMDILLFLVIHESKRDEVTGEWRKLQNEELNYLYSLPNIVWVAKSRRMRWAGHVAHMGEERGVHRVLMGKPEGKRPLGRPRRRWEDNIKMDVEEVGGGRGDWM
jgi:hypothetical protein